MRRPGSVPDTLGPLRLMSGISTNPSLPMASWAGLLGIRPQDVRVGIRKFPSTSLSGEKED